MSGNRMAWAFWGLSRFLLVVLLASGESASISDLNYYRVSLDDLRTDGVEDTLAEYPVPAFLVLALPYALLSAVGAAAAYQVTLMALLVLLDGVFLHMLMRRVDSDAPTTGERSNRLSVLGWLAATPALGAISYARFDLLPGVLIGLALLVLVDSPRRAAILGAMATGVKYTPALVLPGLAAPRRSRGRVLVAGAITGFALMVVSILVGGWDRVVSPLDYQSGRGLQIESTAATPAMLRWAMAPEPFRVHFAKSLAWEIDGPGTQALLLASSVVTGALIVVLLALWVFAWRRLNEPAAALPSVLWLTLGSVTAFITSSKVFSPQYLLWLLPVACAGLALLGSADADIEARRLRRWTAGLLLATLLTHVLFPHGYLSLVGHDGSSIGMVLVLAVRNLVVVGLCLTALWSAYDAIRRVPRRPTDRGEIPASS